MTKKEMIIAAIESLGYKPQIDDDGDIFVRYQMKSFYFLVGEEDENYIVVTLPQFVDVNEGEETQALAVCNKITRDIKLAKVYIDQSFKSVSANCEFFYTDEECLKICSEHAMIILGIVRTAYLNARNELVGE